jgi:hypothetical protein
MPWSTCRTIAKDVFVSKRTSGRAAADHQNCLILENMVSRPGYQGGDVISVNIESQ